MTSIPVLAPLDQARAALYRAMAPRFGPFFRDRTTRTTWIATVAITLSFALTLAAPIWLLAIGPIVFGVPHLLADLRYLVVRPALHRGRPRLLLGLAVVCIVAISCGARSSVGAIAVVALLFAARASWTRRLLMIGVAAAIGFSMQRSGRIGDLVFAHAHNLVALLLWWSWRSRDRRSVGPMLLFGLGVVAIFAGAAEPIMSRLGAFVAPASGLDLWTLTASTGRFGDPTLSLRLLLCFAFAQSVHYAIWLRLVPEDDRPARAPRSFSSSFRALTDDLGLPVVAMFSLASVALILWAVVSLAAARDGYLRVAASHGWIELGAIALAIAERRRPGEATTG